MNQFNINDDKVKLNNKEVWTLKTVYLEIKNFDKKFEITFYFNL